MTVDNCEIGSLANNVKSNNNLIFDTGPTKTFNHGKRKKKIIEYLLSAFPSITELKQYTGVLICGLSFWATSWFVFKEVVLPGGYFFNMTIVVVTGYIFGHTLERCTTLNPVVGMTLVGLLYRNFGSYNFLASSSSADAIDYHLRRICAVVILTKGPLGWHWEYIKNNCVKVFSLATLPWIVECLSIAILTHIWLEFPWYWGIHLGSILASVSPAIVVPTVAALSARGLGNKNQIAHLVSNSGGLDTAFTEGMYGIISTAIFYETPMHYRIVKGLFAMFVGVALGISWGLLADLFPEHSDPYASTIRSIHLMAGGLLVSYASSYFGWGGISGVAIMVCASTASTRWSQRDWPINANPVFEVYKLLWRILEPILFTLSGYYFEMSQITGRQLGIVIGTIMLALFLRMITALLISIAASLSVKEAVFVAITWMPKAIVEAVLVRAAVDSLWKDGAKHDDKRAASQHANIIVIAIIITTTLGSTLTTFLGPILLSQDSRVAPEGTCPTSAASQTQNAVITRNDNSANSLHIVHL